MTTINFYSTAGEYGKYFSNFSAHTVMIDDNVWRTVEHYFQAQKFENLEHQRDIWAARTPGEAARMGRNRAWPLRENWEEIKESVMSCGLAHKFLQHTDARTVLMATGNAYLVEHTTNDSYWGDGGDGTGENRLGVLLMELRDLLQEQEQTNAELADLQFSPTSPTPDFEIQL